jgi:hypothetical protein
LGSGVVLDDAGGTGDYTHGGRWQREELGEQRAVSPRNLLMIFTNMVENTRDTLPKYYANSIVQLRSDHPG